MSSNTSDRQLYLVQSNHEVGTKTFAVPVTFTFNGNVFVSAESPEDAKKIATEGFGLVPASGSFHQNDSRVVDWHFATHPERVSGQPEMVKIVPPPMVCWP